MCSWCSATYYEELEWNFFLRASKHLGVTPFTGKQVKNHKKSAIIDYILLKGHDASFEDFTILLKQNILYIKETFLIVKSSPKRFLKDCFHSLYLLFKYLLLNYSCNLNKICQYLIAIDCNLKEEKEAKNYLGKIKHVCIFFLSLIYLFTSTLVSTKCIF